MGGNWPGSPSHVNLRREAQMGGTDVSECVLAGRVQLDSPDLQSRNQPSLQCQLENFSREIHSTDQLIESNYPVPGSIWKPPNLNKAKALPPGTSVLLGRNKHCAWQLWLTMEPGEGSRAGNRVCGVALATQQKSERKKWPRQVSRERTFQTEGGRVQTPWVNSIATDGWGRWRARAAECEMGCEARWQKGPLKQWSRPSFPRPHPPGRQ